MVRKLCQTPHGLISADDLARVRNFSQLVEAMTSMRTANQTTSIVRYENKFLIPEHQSAEIRDYLSFFAHPDAHSDDGKGNYTITSLYFDTRDLAFYMANHMKIEQRIKPRVRYFGLKPNGSVFLEVKRRQGQIVWKTREALSYGQWPHFLFQPGNGGPPQIEGLDNFRNVVEYYRALPAAFVRYRREAWTSDVDFYGRITFDRCMRGKLAFGATDLCVPDEEMFPFDDAETSEFSESPVILEIKCETLIPRWVSDLVQRFGLSKRGFSKYYNTMRTGMFDHGEQEEVLATRFATQ